MEQQANDADPNLPENRDVTPDQGNSLDVLRTHPVVYYTRPIVEAVFSLRRLEFIAIIIASAALIIDLQDRPWQRRAIAWQIIATPTTSVSAKVESINYLADETVKLSDNSDPRAVTRELRAINLSGSKDNWNVLDYFYVNNINLSGSIFKFSSMTNAKFRDVILNGVTFEEVDMSRSMLFNTEIAFSKIIKSQMDRIKWISILAPNVLFSDVNISRFDINCDSQCYFRPDRLSMSHGIITGGNPFKSGLDWNIYDPSIDGELLNPDVDDFETEIDREEAKKSVNALIDRLNHQRDFSEIDLLSIHGDYLHLSNVLIKDIRTHISGRYLELDQILIDGGIRISGDHVRGTLWIHSPPYDIEGGLHGVYIDVINSNLSVIRCGSASTARKGWEVSYARNFSGFDDYWKSSLSTATMPNWIPNGCSKETLRDTLAVE